MFTDTPCIIKVCNLKYFVGNVVKTVADYRGLAGMLVAAVQAAGQA